MVPFILSSGEIKIVNVAGLGNACECPQILPSLTNRRMVSMLDSTAILAVCPYQCAFRPWPSADAHRHVPRLELAGLLAPLLDSGMAPLKHIGHEQIRRLPSRSLGHVVGNLAAVLLVKVDADRRVVLADLLDGVGMLTCASKLASHLRHTEVSSTNPFQPSGPFQTLATAEP